MVRIRGGQLKNELFRLKRFKKWEKLIFVQKSGKKESSFRKERKNNFCSEKWEIIIFCTEKWEKGIFVQKSGK